MAFNDPPADFETQELIHLVRLDEACRKQQVGEGHFASVDETPDQALSLTVNALLRPPPSSCSPPRRARPLRCSGHSGVR